MLHGAPIGRYSPSFERVWSKAPIIKIAGVKDRFGYGNKNSPHFIKVAEGQASAVVPARIGSRKQSMLTQINPPEDALVLPETTRNRANTTVVQFYK